MKKILFYIAILSIATILASCNQNDQTNEADDNEQVNETEQPAENNNDETTQEKTNEAGETEQNTEKDGTPNTEEKVYQNKIFKDVKVSEMDNQMVITGKAQVFEGVFDYALYDGEDKLLEDHYQTVGAPSWGDFEIKIDKTTIAQPKNEVRLELFVYSAKDGSKENILNIPLSNH
ncbi:Gmad2 immunoglobulin-like domain-containing protein [Fredinandcohnia sp. QZ13]|uniref:Gmad2 immunoglobulin-like domain-containing protein n=1 Tax=Fredinandcohnia sp. QZ13 TaxID=3073144 RepID=UPI002853556B|nr:Gmad2 immunoglobulin-like domain-containing protein [Fredinandcohnia sp. QZ13]MDR4889560.1 Gmad2 immunoglobulin-like domain-containing protein [Fredinandcohnia sp. QZ13]